jgi:hypothetical protein
VAATQDAPLPAAGTYDDYRRAAALLWGAAGDFAAAAFARLNREHFAGSIPPLPLIIALPAFGRCIGATRDGAGWLAAPRVTLAPELFNGSSRTAGGPRMVCDALLHEMTHVVLLLRGDDPGHNGAPWCRLIASLAPGVLGREVTARPVLPRRVANPARAADPAAPKTVVVRRAGPGEMARAELAHWPQSQRPAGYYRADASIRVPAY